MMSRLPGCLTHSELIRYLGWAAVCGLSGPEAGRVMDLGHTLGNMKRLKFVSNRSPARLPGLAMAIIGHYPMMRVRGLAFSVWGSEASV